MNKTACLWCATSGVAPLLVQSLGSAKAAGIDPRSMFVLLMDDGLAPILQREGIDANLLRFPPDTYRVLGMASLPQFTEYGTAEFRKLSFVRYIAIGHLMLMGFDNVLYTDADILFLANPLDDLLCASNYATDAILMQNDSRDWGDGRTAMRLGKGEGVDDEIICTGFNLWRNTPEHKAIIRGLLNVGADLEWKQSCQELFNRVKGNFAGAIQILPASKYPNGAVYVHMGESIFDAAPFIFHANWVVGLKDKLLLMNEFSARRAPAVTRTAPPRRQDSP
jgi:hypothetical protein